MTRGLRELAGLTLAAAVALAALLLAGQAARLVALLRGAALPWPELLLWATVGLGEVLVPLAGLIGAALAFGRWRGDAHLTALWALGLRPARVLAPVAAWGFVLGALTAWLGHGAGPNALARVSELVRAGLAAAPYGPEGLPLGEGGLVRGLRGPDGAPAELWAALPQRDRWVILRAAALEPTPEGPVLREAQLWTPGLRASVGTARLDTAGAFRLPGTLRPPQTQATAALSLDDPRARWLRHRRSCLAALAPCLTLLGAVLGGAAGRTPAVLGAAAAIGLAYWLLRLGDLAVRDGTLSPLLAGWLPLIVLLPLSAAAARLLWGRFRA